MVTPKELKILESFRCSTCNEEDAIELHGCPYVDEMTSCEDKDEEYCNCCRKCVGECADAI